MTDGPTIHSPVAQNPLVAKVLQDAQSKHAHVQESSSSDISRSSRVASSFDESRASTPDSALEMSFRKADRRWDEKAQAASAAAAAVADKAAEEEALLLAVGAAGRQPEEVYTNTLNWWRAGIRRAILRNVQAESVVLARMQVR